MKKSLLGTHKVSTASFHRYRVKNSVKLSLFLTVLNQTEDSFSNSVIEHPVIEHLDF